MLLIVTLRQELPVARLIHDELAVHRSHRGCPRQHRPCLGGKRHLSEDRIEGRKRASPRAGLPQDGFRTRHAADADAQRAERADQVLVESAGAVVRCPVGWLTVGGAVYRGRRGRE